MPPHARTEARARLVAALALAAAGCAEPGDRPGAADERPIDAAAEAIVAGAVDEGHAAVVALTYGGQPFCSGTLVAPTVVVTAAHCLHPDMTGGIPIADMQVFFGTDVTAGGGTFVDVIDGLYEDSWYLEDPQADDDVGVLRLAEPGPAEPLPMGELPPAGTPLTLVGFGVTSTGGEGAGVKRSAESTIDQVGPKIFSMRVDPQGTCNGDSGGTAIATVDGVETFVGIHTRSDCVAVMLDERVDAHLEGFILPFLGEAGCGADLRCATGCGDPDPDCPCAADGHCTAACGDPADDVDCDPACAAGNTCATECPVPDVDCPTCDDDGVCEDGCADDPDCAAEPAGAGAGGRGAPGAGGAAAGSGGSGGGAEDAGDPSAAGDAGCAAAARGPGSRATTWTAVLVAASLALRRRRRLGR